MSDTSTSVPYKTHLDILYQLHQAGIVGADLWAQFLGAVKSAAMKELDTAMSSAYPVIQQDVGTVESAVTTAVASVAPISTEPPAETTASDESAAPPPSASIQL